MFELKRLKEAKGKYQVADLLGYKPQALTYLLYKLAPEAKYKRFEIPKRDGGTRTINAPCPELKKLQQRLSRTLLACEAEIRTKKNIKSVLAHGFVPNYSIITNAAVHKGRRFVFNIDLHNFFGSVNFGRVRGFFLKNREYALAPATATVLAQIACFEDVLPQGSPCSPVISNLIANILDIRLAEIAKRTGCTYSRYADDITFSTNRRDFPKQVARLIVGVPHVWEVGKELQRAIERTGFEINPRKTRMQYCQSRQEVTGLVVNQKVNVRSEFRHLTRAMVYRFCGTGSFQCTMFEKDADGEIKPKKIDGTPAELKGRLNFADMISLHTRKKNGRETNHDDVYAKEGSESNFSADERTYEHFLFYSMFVAAERPLILCEGKTDSIYLRCAIEQLAENYPSLIDIIDGKKFLKVRFFTYSNVTDRILGLAGGASQLSKFMINYHRRSSRFKGPGFTNPVIVVADNDSGTTHFYGALKITRNDTLPFYNLAKNMRMTMTPLLPGKSETMIEHFFDPDVTGIKLGKKVFSWDNKFDIETQYGKRFFAEHVVFKNRDKIDFSGFIPLLDRIVLAISA